MAKDKGFVREITPQSEDFSQWYLDVIKKADLSDYSPVRGCIVFKPDGYEIWERCQAGLDWRFKETGHRNAYFPLFIPESLFMKEVEHVEGFNPELPWVTEVGGEKLAERLAIRPTSETMIGEMYHRWIQSYRDLPVLINQWANVVRWEKRTLPFLRTSEFLWQEGHTAHRTEQEAREEVMRMLGVYQNFVETDLAIPVVPGRKSESEKFAGAAETFSIEAMMKDGKALQAGTSHFLGQNFSKVFDIQFLDDDSQRKYVWTTSWGMSTRIVGAMIMVHGDDRGLVLPPKVAPIQVVVVPILKKGQDDVRTRAGQVADRLRGVARVRFDDREEYSPGWKFNDWEMRGIPIRVEIGPKDLEKNQAVLARRDTGEKLFVSLDGLEDTVAKLLVTIQKDMYERAKTSLAENTRVAHSFDELADIIETKRGFVLAGWCGSTACEAAVKEKTKATTRNIPLEQRDDVPDTCVVCGEHANHKIIFARAY
ncbi:MAG: proline--tRNA ligase [Symbiobacteriia bacterium]